MPSGYSDPSFGVILSAPVSAPVDTNAAADSIRACWVPPINRAAGTMNAKVIEAAAVVVVAGTTSALALKVLKGTTSIGQIVVGTEAAGTRVVAALADTNFDSTDVLRITNSASDATGKFSPSVDWQERFVSTTALS